MRLARASLCVPSWIAWAWTAAARKLSLDRPQSHVTPVGLPLFAAMRRSVLLGGMVGRGLYCCTCIILVHERLALMRAYSAMANHTKANIRRYGEDEI